jgi:hypothetical protein
MMPVQYEKSLLQRLDDMFLWTGLPQRIPSESRAQRRYRLRWISIFILVTQTIGMAMLFIFPQKYGIDYMVLVTGNIGAGFLPMFGPLRAPFGEPADERERNLRRDAYLVGFGSISVTAVFGLFALANLTIIQNWPSDRLFWVMIALMIYLCGLCTTVPTLYASWTLPKPVDDEA